MFNRDKFIFLFFMALPMVNIYINQSKHFLSLSVISTCLVSIFVILKTGKIFTRREDYLFILFYTSATFSFLISLPYLYDFEKAITYHLILPLVYVSFFMGVRTFFVNYSIPLATLYRYLFYSLLLASAVSIIEFIYGYYTHTELMSIFKPFSYVNQGTYKGLLRSQSLFFEPNHYAFFVALFYPLAFYYSKKLSFLGRSFSRLVIIIGFVFSFSAAGFLIVAVDIIILLFVGKIKTKVYFISGLLLVVFFSMDVLSILSTIINKLNYLNGNFEVGSRFDRWDLLLSNLDNIFFGVGPGQSESVLGFTTVSFFLRILFEYGVISFLLLLFFFINLLTRAFRFFIHTGEIFLFLSVINLIIFLFATPTFFYPFLWVCIAIISLSYLSAEKRGGQTMLIDKRFFNEI
jgi:hypothetical protein